MLKTALFSSLKILLLAFVAIFLTIYAGRFIHLNPALQPAPEAQQMTALMLLVVQLILSVLLYFAAVKSDFGGWRLYLALLCVYFGLHVIMANIEAFIFITALAPLTRGDVFMIMLKDLFVIPLYLVALVLLVGRWRTPATANPRPLAEILNRQLLWKVILLALIYPAIYFGFGRMVAWQFAAVREYYATTTIVNSQLLLTLIQIMRGALWVGFGLPIFLMFRSDRRAIVFSALFYSILASVSLLIPNSFMPTAVRIPHLIELATSMLVFGLLVGVVMMEWKLFAPLVGLSKPLSGHGHV